MEPEEARPGLLTGIGIVSNICLEIPNSTTDSKTTNNYEQIQVIELILTISRLIGRVISKPDYLS